MIKIKRKERKMTRNFLSDGICSISLLQRIENQNAKVDFDTLLQLLDRMNIQIDEYALEYNNYKKTKKNNFRSQFISSLTDPSKIVNFINQLDIEYKKTNDIFYLLLKVEAKIVAQKIPDIKNIQLSSEEIILIYKHLDKMDNWDYFELSMYGNCLFIFNEKKLLFDFADILGKFKKSSSLSKHHRAGVKFLINSLIIAFDNQTDDIIPILLEELYVQTKNSDDIKGRLYWKLFNELYLSKSGELVFNPDEIPTLFSKLGYDADAKNIRDIISTIVDNNGF